MSFSCLCKHGRMCVYMYGRYAPGYQSPASRYMISMQMEIEEIIIK